MNHFKKRTLALILASTMTVVGAFGAENYKNSLMSLEFESDSNGAVNVKLYTKLKYDNNIIPKKLDPTTYVIMLPEMDSQGMSEAKLSNNVEKYDIKTMPYTTGNKGYTKITIKTLPNVPLIATNSLYIASSETEENKVSENTVSENAQSSQESYKYTENNSKSDTVNKQVSKTETTINDSGTYKTNKSSQNAVDSQDEDTFTPKQSEKTNIADSDDSAEDNSYEIMLIIMSSLIIIFVSIFLYLRSKDKIAQITGESDFSLDDDEPKEKKKTIKKKIKEFDKTYKNPVKMPIGYNINETKDENNTIVISKPQIEPEKETAEEPEKENNVIVDLDVLYNEKNNETENEALNDFLSEFNFEEESIEEPEEEISIDESLYEKYIINGNINFSQEDIEKINELINTEIQDETIKNISQYAVSNPIKKEIPESLSRLENLVSSYIIDQNLSFTSEDIDALEKLTKVELDSDFVKDLTTNPARTEEMRKEIESRKVVHKNHEILTLNVKDVLPNLSEALKKQGGKAIESEVKPQVVYYSEGFDYQTLSVKDDLPITLDLDDPEYNKYRPSDDFEYVDSKYDVDKLNVENELPDLEDVVKHPEKYEEKRAVVHVDAEALLENVTHATFKPFYNGEKIEILNDFDDSAESEENNNEIAELENTTEQTKNEEEQLPENTVEEVTKSEPKQINKQTQIHKEQIDYKRTSEQANNLIKQIEKRKQEQISKVTNTIREEKIIPQDNIKEEEITQNSCLIDGKEYKIISKYSLTDNMGCYLAQINNEYAILGYVGDSIFKIKYYKKLSSNKLQARINEKLNDGTIQYIVRIGLHKFILNVKKDKMEYVMDLC